MVGGLSAAFFLNSLEVVGELQEQNPYYAFLMLPALWLIQYLYQKYGQNRAELGNKLVLQEYQQPTKKLPLAMAPLVYIGTLLTHIAGGSAGREGTAVQIATTLADAGSDRFGFTGAERRFLILLGIVAGFAAVFGTPLAAVVFALEVVKRKHLRLHFLPAIILTAWVAHYTCLQLATHAVYPHIDEQKLGLMNLISMVVLGLACGATAFLYRWAHQNLSNLYKGIRLPLLLKSTLAAVLLMACYLLFNLDSYAGLGIEVIQTSFLTVAKPEAFIIKLLLTAYALAIGFKGGEVTPLFFIGTTLASSLSIWLSLPLESAAAIGFVTVFSAAAKTPLAGVFIAYEIFGPNLIIPAAIACLVAHLVSSKKSIYD